MLKCSKIKKSISIILFLVLYLNVLIFSHPLVTAQTEIVDQQNNSVSSAGNQIHINGHKQTFTPSISQITKIQVYITNRIEGENLLMIIRDEFTNDVVESRAKEMSQNGEGWEVFSFTSLFLVPGNVYSIELQTSYYDSDTPIWMKSEVDTYQGGSHKEGSETYDDDMVFVTWGYDNESITDSSISELPTTGEGELEENNESYENYTTRKNYWEVEVTNIDDDMMIPEIEFIKYNGNVVVLEEGKSINVYSDDTLEVLGSTSAGMNVIIYIGQGAFITEADSNGNWVVQVNCDQIKKGEFEAKIQAQEDEVGSQIRDAFSLNRMEGKNPEGSRVNLEDTILYTLFIGEYKIYTYSILFFIIFLFALMFIIRKNKQKKTVIKSKDISKEKKIKEKKEKEDRAKKIIVKEKIVKERKSEEEKDEKKKIEEKKIEKEKEDVRVIEDKKQEKKKVEKKVDEKTEKQKAVIEAINEQLRDFGKPIDYGDAGDTSEKKDQSNNEGKEDKGLEKFKKDIEKIKNMSNDNMEDS